MTSFGRKAVLAALLVALPVPVGGSAYALRQGDVTHRIVWNSPSRDGYTVWASDVDGQHLVKLASSDRGEVWNISVNRDGRRVAFSREVRRERAHLLVTRTAGGRVVDLLANQRRIESVGPIGWDPSGRRLAFVGYVDEPSTGLFFPSYLWTIRADGTHLRRRILIDSGDDNGAIFGELGWTRAGIIYPDGDEIRVLRRDRSKVIATRALEMYASGNGRWIVFRRHAPRPRLGLAIWRMHPDGTGLERLLPYGFETALGSTFGWAPNHDGSLLIGSETNDAGRLEAFTYRPARPFEPTVLPFMKRAFIIDWN